MESLPPPDVSLPKGATEEYLLPRRYEVYASDYEWAQHVRGSLLRLEADDSPSKRQIECSGHFQFRTATSEMEPPEVIAEHWLDNLRNDGVLVECPPDQFTAPADWILLYISEGLQRYLLAALSAFPSQGVPSLIAVTPPKFHVGSDKEFLLCNFHRHGCLMRQSFNIEGKCRQLAFCPYCGVINENSDTALSHVRKHLDPPICLWRLLFPKLPQWTGSQQTHENMCLGNCHQRPLQPVGLLQWTPSSITRLRKAEPSDCWGPSHEAPPFLITLITKGSLVWSLRTYVHQDVDLMLEAECPVDIYIG